MIAISHAPLAERMGLALAIQTVAVDAAAVDIVKWPVFHLLSNLLDACCMFLDRVQIRVLAVVAEGGPVQAVCVATLPRLETSGCN